MVRFARESLMSALSFGIVLAALVSYDPRVRVRFRSLFEDQGTAALSPFGDRLGDLGDALWMAARDQSLDNGAVLLFAAVGALLVVFMLRMR